jgi:flagellar biosynthesis protein FlhG
VDAHSPNAAVRNKPTIIPIAGGKGGVGKSFLSANLAIALAQAGRETIAVDLDLGASSLFTFLGLANRFPGIGDFVRAKRGDLSALLVPTELPNLRFLPGDGRSPFMANIAHAQKKKILRGLKTLPAEYLILDLGSGSSYNTLDFFSLGQTGIMVTTPDHPSILKMLTFLKNLLLRKIEETLGSSGYLKALLGRVYDLPIESQINTLTQLAERLRTEDHDLERSIEEIRSGFRPRIVFNMGTKPDDLDFTRLIDDSLGTVLGITADYFGFLYEDRHIREAIQARRPYLLTQPDSITSQEIMKIAERIQKFWDSAVPGSADLIQTRARKIFQDRPALKDDHSRAFPANPS